MNMVKEEALPKGEQCDCRICQEIRKHEDVMTRIQNKDDKEFLEDVYDRFLQVSEVADIEESLRKELQESLICPKEKCKHWWCKMCYDCKRKAQDFCELKEVIE